MDDMLTLFQFNKVPPMNQKENSVSNCLRMPRLHELRHCQEEIALNLQDDFETEQSSLLCTNCGKSSNSAMFLIPNNGIFNNTKYLCYLCIVELLAEETAKQVLKNIYCDYIECQVHNQIDNSDIFQSFKVRESVEKKLIPKSSSSGSNKGEIVPKICFNNFGEPFNEDIKETRENVQIEFSRCGVPVDEVDTSVKIETEELSLQRVKSVKFAEVKKENVNHGSNRHLNEQLGTQIRCGVPLSQYYTDEMRIGSGKFGKVSRVTHKETKNTFAAKTIIYRSQKTKDNIINEIEILCCLYGNEHVMQLIEVIDNNISKPKTLHLITEYLGGGELFDQIANDELLTEEQVVGIMCQILDGLIFIHERGIIHRDLKPENIVYSSKDNDLLKIIDFGFAVKFDDKMPPKSMVGTTIFVAPEVLRFEPQSYFTDMWSVGVITYNLLAGITPFEIPFTGDPMRHLSDHEIIENIERCQYDFSDEGFIGVSDEAKNFISSLLIRDPSKRLTAIKCLNHDWLLPCSKNKHINLFRSISLHRMKNYVAVQKWKKLSMAIKSVNNFKSSVIS